ncbi:glycosyl hydrolase [Saccharibacillus sp. O16]|nr:glycosyl hydrolase [Saccharibacillus sp. O16]
MDTESRNPSARTDSQQPQSRESGSLPAWLDEAWMYVSTKTRELAGRIGDSFPHAAPNGKYDEEPPQWWTSGFWPGLLNLVERETGEPELRRIAAACEVKLEDALRDAEQVDHDLGFLWLPTGVASYRRDGGRESRRRALLAANLLAARFNVQGHYLRAWNFEGQEMDTRGVAIIDSMMNLPLLHWASEETQDPRFRQVAMLHADMVLKHFVRHDHSVCHAVEFDPETGMKIKEHGGQGFAQGSAWARGTAWALHGFALSYGYTGKPQYLDAAERIAGFFLEQLGQQVLPVWDFRADEEHRGAWDSSAAAIAASGLLELSRHSTQSAMFHEAALSLVHGLYKQLRVADDQEGLLQKGTVHYPQRRHLNVPIIYGDYFFAEALAKLRGYPGFFEHQ